MGDDEFEVCRATVFTSFTYLLTFNSIFFIDCCLVLFAYFRLIQEKNIAYYYKNIYIFFGLSVSICIYLISSSLLSFLLPNNCTQMHASLLFN